MKPPLQKGIVMKENTTEQISNTEKSVSSSKSFREIKETSKKKIDLKYLREKDREPVKGMFKYYELPGGMLEFSLKLHDGDPVVKYSLLDGEVYTLPLGAAKHLNKNMWYPIHEHRVEENGKSSQIIGKKVRRAGFHHLEFVDIEDLSPNGYPEIEVVSMAKM
jgi:hypothetical protein